MNDKTELSHIGNANKDYLLFEGYVTCRRRLKSLINLEKHFLSPVIDV